MRQERVRQARKAEPPTAPVQADLETPRWLCTTIQIQKQPAGLEVTLTWDAARKAQILLADPHLRLVLDIFCNSYAKAGWDLCAFPGWLGLELDLSRICAAPSARLGHLAFEGQGAFASQC